MFGVLIRPGKTRHFNLEFPSLIFHSLALRSVARLTVKRIQDSSTSEIARNFSQLTIQPSKPLNIASNIISQPTASVLNNPAFLKLTTTNLSQVRTVTKFSMRSGKRKTVKAVLKRFKRLDWGIWIRTRTARHKRLWKKSKYQKYKLRQHVFTNATQSWMLDKMVTSRWRKPKHYVDDPYRPYHDREDFLITRKKPIEWD